MNNAFRLMQYLVVASLLLAGSAIAAPPVGADFEMGGSGSEAGKFADLRDMAFDGNDNLYTLEGPKLTKDRDQSYPGNARVQKFDNSGKPLSQFPIVDEALGENDDPRHIALDKQGHVYITYPTANLVREFDAQGKKVRDIEIPGATAVANYNGAIAVIGGSRQIVSGRWADVGGDLITVVDGGNTRTVQLPLKLDRVVDMAADSAGNFYVLANVNALYKFSPEGELLKTVGAQTQTRVEDGSELSHSVALDSQGNVYAMAGNFLTRFDPAFSTVAQREVRYRWFEPSGWQLLAIDSKDRIFASTPSLVVHQLFERFHFRPVIMRLDSNYFEPGTMGVRIASALGLGLKASIQPRQEFSVAYDLEEFAADLVVPAANRNVEKVTVEYHVFDAYRNAVEHKTVEMPLTQNQEGRVPLNFTPPKYGWYLIDAAIRAGDEQLFRIGQQVGVTPDFSGMIRMAKVEGLGGTSDAPKQMFVGLANMRLNASHDPKSLDSLEKSLAAALEYGATPFVAFTDEKDITEESVRAAVTRFKGRVKVWEIINEANLRMTPEKYVNDYLKLASRIIHEVDPEAKVMGPTGCGINLEWYEGFYKAGGGELIDILSIHDYEGHEAFDPIHWRWKIGALREIMARYGDAEKPIWQTERVFSALRGGSFMGLYQAVNMAQQRDTLETLGIRSEHNNHYYLNEMGYASVPSYIWGSRGPHPAAFVMRTRYAQVLGREYAGTLDFGRSGNDIFSGLRFKGGDGQTIILRNTGTVDQQLILGVSGGENVQWVDPWGNVTTLPIERGKVELTVTQLPQYLKLSNSQEVSAPEIDFGQNLAPRATFEYSARIETPLSLLNNGIIEVIHSGNPTGGTNGAMIFTGDLPEIDGKVAPQTLDIRLDGPQAIDRIVLRGLRPDNQFCTLLDYDIQAHVDGGWKTLVEARTEVPPSDPISVSPALCVQWNGSEHLMMHKLDPIITDRLRLVALRTTHGFSFDKLAADATYTIWGGGNKPKLMLREIEIYAPTSAIAVSGEPSQPVQSTVFSTQAEKISFANTTDQSFTGNVTITAPEGWKVEPAQIPLSLPAGQRSETTVQVTPADELSIGQSFVDVAVSAADGQYSGRGWLAYTIASPIELKPGGVRDMGKPGQAFTADIKNITDQPVSGTVTVNVAGRDIEKPFGPIEPGQNVTVPLPTGELQIAGKILTADYSATVNHLTITATQPLGVRQWNVIGTWPNDLETPVGPESTRGKVDLSTNYTDGMGQEQKWQIINSDPSGYLNLLSLKPNKNITAYALIYVNSPADRKAIFSAGTDDGGKAWLNGTEVFVDTKKHDSAPGQVMVPVTLKAGQNEVLFKIVQGSHNMGLHLDLLDEAGKPMADLDYSPNPAGGQ